MTSWPQGLLDSSGGCSTLDMVVTFSRIHIESSPLRSGHLRWAVAVSSFLAAHTLQTQRHSHSQSQSEISRSSDRQYCCLVFVSFGYLLLLLLFNIFFYSPTNLLLLYIYIENDNGPINLLNLIYEFFFDK